MLGHCALRLRNQSPTQTVPAAAAEAGKDVVHQLNNAFAKVVRACRAERGHHRGDKEKQMATILRRSMIFCFQNQP